MVNPARRIFFVIGTDFLHRQRAIENIKTRILHNKSSPINTIIFYSKEIEMNDLRKKVLTFSFDKEKIIIFKNASALTMAIKKFFVENLKEITSSNYLIFEIEQDHRNVFQDTKLTKDKFFSFLLKRGTILRISSTLQRLTLDDFKRSIRRSDYARSFYILEKLFEKEKGKDLGPQILGILVYEFSRTKNPHQKEKYFSYLWETDRAIKEKGVNSRLALEVLIARLSASS
ncbi:MAG: hypothetical protein JSW40_10075 [Candidatus Omnitrophota bacterium]|nr:MAG: hypothetical protein JSW40_10075 [Candidatus Omnitrophota bacterium]